MPAPLNCPHCFMCGRVQGDRWDTAFRGAIIIDNGDGRNICDECHEGLNSPPPKPFKSFAHWPDGSVSDDGHDTREQAVAMCQRLEREGFSGEGRSFPLSTWVESSASNERAVVLHNFVDMALRAAPAPVLKPVLKDLSAFKSKQREEPWGALLVRYGFDPYETESSARRVAERAAEEIGLLSQSIHNVLVHMAALGVSYEEESLVRARAAIERINRKRINRKADQPPSPSGS